MQKVGYFKSIHVKIVLIYVLLIVIAMQIIGLYFVRELEITLRKNFQDSISDRVSLIEYSAREEMIKVRSEEDQTKEQILKDISIAKKHFEYFSINVFCNNSTKIQRDENLATWFENEIFPTIRDEKKIEILLKNTDLNVG